METKVCSKCGGEKNIKNFPRNRRVCYECNKEYYKKYYHKNKTTLSCRNNEWTKNNKEKVNSRKRRWAKNNKEKTKQATQKWLKNNKEKRLQIDRNYYHNTLKNNIQWKITNSLRGRVRVAIKDSNKSDSTINLLSCSIPELINHLEKQFTKGMSWDNYGEWHIDHIKPCSSFDLTKPEQQKICFHYTNLQPLWAKDNMSKSNKIM